MTLQAELAEISGGRTRRFPCRYHSTMVLHAHIPPGGWAIGPLVVAVQRRSPTSSTWSSSTRRWIKLFRSSCIGLQKPRALTARGEHRLRVEGKVFSTIPEPDKQEVIQGCRSFITCTHHQILFGWSNKRTWETHTRFWLDGHGKYNEIPTHCRPNACQKRYQCFNPVSINMWFILQILNFISNSMLTSLRIQTHHVYRMSHDEMS
jgi:hypothetical protein